MVLSPGFYRSLPGTIDLGQQSALERRTDRPEPNGNRPGVIPPAPLRPPQFTWRETSLFLRRYFPFQRKPKPRPKLEISIATTSTRNCPATPRGSPGRQQRRSLWASSPIQPSPASCDGGEGYPYNRANSSSQLAGSSVRMDRTTNGSRPDTTARTSVPATKPTLRTAGPPLPEDGRLNNGDHESGPTPFPSKRS